MLFVFQHDLVGQGQKNGGSQECHVDENFPLNVFGICVRDVNERFEQVNAGDADQRSGQFDLDRTGVDVAEPVGTVRMALQAQFAHEGGIAPDDHHGQQIGHHGDIDQSEYPEHELGFFEALNVDHHVPQFDQKLIRVQEFRNDQSAVEWGLNPTAGKDDRFERVFEGAGAVWDG